MKRFYISEKLNDTGYYVIEGIEHNHIKNVMRMSVGDKLILVCGDEYDYLCQIIDMCKGNTKVEILSKELNRYNPKSNITVFQALVKSDNMSLIVQKLTELGVSTLIPFESEFITSKDKSTKTAKLQEISNQSIKQCKRSIPMSIGTTLSFKGLLETLKNYDEIIFANECEREGVLELSNLRGKKVAIIVGSEGGFSENEIDLLKSNGVKSISMGKRILRAETASIALTSVVMYMMGEWSCE